jgi:large subunit ribosomal protein L4
MDIKMLSGSQFEASDAVFGCDYNEGLIHQVVTSYMTTGRAGTKAQKNRSAVSGGGAKPWRQKGTGRARAGTSRTNIWRHGGVTFAASPRDYTQKVNKKMYRAAMRSILSTLVAKDRLIAAESFKLPEAKTKHVAELVKSINLEGSLLLLTAEQDDDLFLAARNLPHVEVFSVSQLNPVALVGYDHIVATQDAIALLAERLQ